MIPKCIYQFWDKHPPPAEIARLTATWRHNHGAFGYFLYDDCAAAKLIARNFPKDVFEAFLISRLPTMRSDLFRYAVLFLYGGIYVDADEESIDSMENFVDLSKELIVRRRRKKHEEPENYSPLSRDFIIQGGFVAAKPSLEVMNNAIMQAAKNIHDRSSNNPGQVTGPVVLGEEIRNLYQGKTQNLSVLEIEYYRNFVKLYGRNLPYKKGDRHWSKVMERESIYYESIAESPVCHAGDRGFQSYARLLVDRFRSATQRSKLNPRDRDP